MIKDKRKGKNMNKILLLNGSPHAHGCTAAALEEMIRTFEEEGMTTELIHVGNKSVSPAAAVPNLENVFLTIS